MTNVTDLSQHREKKIKPINKEDLEGLPEEVLKQLSEAAKNTSPIQKYSDLIEAFKSLGGIATVDHLIIEVYKTQQKVITRPATNNKLGKMAEEGILEKTSRGVYKLIENEE